MVPTIIEFTKKTMSCISAHREVQRKKVHQQWKQKILADRNRSYTTFNEWTSDGHELKRRIMVFVVRSWRDFRKWWVIERFQKKFQKHKRTFWSWNGRINGKVHHTFVRVHSSVVRQEEKQNKNRKSSSNGIALHNTKRMKRTLPAPKFESFSCKFARRRKKTKNEKIICVVAWPS